MSKPRYSWWGYIKSVIRKYPKHCNAKELSDIAQREKAAVDAAIKVTKGMYDGADRLKIISMVYWEKSHTLYGAAVSLPCSYETAKRYQRRFILEVAKHFKCNGLL